MPIVSQSGPAMILASDTLTSFMGHPLVLTIDHPFPLVLEFRFESDDSGEIGVQTETGADRMLLRCTNFVGADGRGSAQPVLLGGIEDLLLFLHFRVFLYGRTDDHTLHYTLYGVDKGAVNWTPSGSDDAR